MNHDTRVFKNRFSTTSKQGPVSPRGAKRVSTAAQVVDWSTASEGGSTLTNSSGQKYLKKRLGSIQVWRPRWVPKSRQDNRSCVKFIACKSFWMPTQALWKKISTFCGGHMCMGTCKTATFEISSGKSTWGYLNFIATYEAPARIPIGLIHVSLLRRLCIRQLLHAI